MGIGVLVLLGVAAGCTGWAIAKPRSATRSSVRRLARRNLKAVAVAPGRYDTAFTNTLQRQHDSLVRIAQSARGDQAIAVQKALQQHHDLKRAIAEMGLPAVRDANNAAVRDDPSDIGTDTVRSDRIRLTANGGVITNRHVVTDSAGNRAKASRQVRRYRRVARARIVRSSRERASTSRSSRSTTRGTYPSVKGVAPSVSVRSVQRSPRSAIRSARTCRWKAADGARRLLTPGTISKIDPRSCRSTRSRRTARAAVRCSTGTDT